MNRVLAAAVVIVGTSLGASAAAAPQHETLIVYKAGSGSGHVGSRPPYIDCGNVCYAPLPVEETGGVPIVLRATPDPGSVFTGWGGACEGAEPTCTLELQRSERVTAIFDRTGAQTSFPLAVGKTGEGTVRSSPAAISCEPSCSASFTSGTSVTLTATPAAGWTFAGWSGACSGSGACTLTMDSPKTVTASFAQLAEQPGPSPPPPPPPQTFVLAVGKSGTGTVTSSPSGIDCGTACSASFAAGTAVMLTARPARGWAFSGWSGACAGSAETCSLVLEQATSTSALFRDNRDTAAPSVKALASSGKRGTLVRLRYRVVEDSGKSRETVVVRSGKRVLKTITGPLDAAEPGVLYYYVSWKVPRSVRKGVLRFCVTALDAAGNRSRPSCAPLRIR